MPDASSLKRWKIAAAVLIIATVAIIAVPFIATEPLDRVAVRSVPKAPAQASPHGHGMPGAPPAMPTGNGAMPAATPAAPSDAALIWTLPPGWSQIATKQMRLASFSAGEGAECGLFLLPPGASDRLANVNRWRGQAGLPAIDAAGLEKELVAGTCGFGPFHWLTVRGTSRAFLAAIATTPGGPCFVKLEAPGDRLDALRDGFLAFTASLRPGNGTAP